MLPKMYFVVLWFVCGLIAGLLLPIKLVPSREDDDKEEEGKD